MTTDYSSPRRVGSKWDAVIRQLKETHRVMLRKNCISTLKDISKSKELKKIINFYLNEQLKPVLKKCSKLSEEIRTEGNKSYKDNSDLFKSSFLYSLSIKCSSSNFELAYAHANRSAALIKLGFSSVARDDCKEALKLEHPDPFKIYERLCSLSNGNIQEMRANILGLEKHVSQKKSSKEILQKYKTRLKAMEKEIMCQEEDLSINKLTLNSGETKLKQMFSEKAGRYVVAQKPIARNEKILTETPFAFVPVNNYAVKKYFNTDCECCGLVNVWPFLCLECRHATYCSSNCRESHKILHKYECEGYKKNLFYEIGIAHLSLRVLLVGFSSLIGILESLDKSEYKNCPEKIYNRIIEKAAEITENYFTSEEQSDFFEYAKVLNLQPNLLRNDSFPSKNLPYAYTAQMIASYLRESTSFFEDFIKGEIDDLLQKDEWDLLISALILRHIGQLISNGHAIVDFRQNVFTTDALKLMLCKNQPNGGGLHLLLKSQRIFTGIFPRISMLNHNCDPNIRNCFDGTNLTIISSRDINSGEEIFNCYGKINSTFKY
jgi:hypothetical protein